jgi:hypothetical protein
MPLAIGPAFRAPSSRCGSGQSATTRRRRGEPTTTNDPAPGSHGRYHEYHTPNGPRVIAEHTNDPTAPHGHFHAYQPKKDHTGITIGEKYDRVDGPHHYYYGRHDPKWPKKH